MKTTSPYKTAEELGVAQWEHDGLVALIGPLSRGQVALDMRCGTAACIGGHVALAAEMAHGSHWESGHAAPALCSSKELEPLYYPGRERVEVCHPAWRCDASQAARAIVNFLTLGDPRWDDVMRELA